MKTIEQIRASFQRIHRIASNQERPGDGGYMRIPADPEHDADLIVSAAIDELESLRAELAETKANMNSAVAALTKRVVELKDELKIAWSDEGDPLKAEVESLRSALATSQAESARLRGALEEVVSKLGDIWRSKPPDARPWWFVRLESALSSTPSTSRDSAWNEAVEACAALVDAAEDDALKEAEGVVYGDPGGCLPVFPDDLVMRLRRLARPAGTKETP